MKKLTVVLFALMATLLLFTACQNGTDEETTAPEETTASEETTEIEETKERNPEIAVPENYKLVKCIPGAHTFYNEEKGIYTFAPNQETIDAEKAKIEEMGLTLEFYVPDEWRTYQDGEEYLHDPMFVRDFEVDGELLTTTAHQMFGIIPLEDPAHFDEYFHGLTLVGQNNIPELEEGVVLMYTPAPLKDYMDSIHTGTTAKGYDYVSYGDESCPFFCYVRITDEYVLPIEYPFGAKNEDLNFQIILDTLEVKTK